METKNSSIPNGYKNFDPRSQIWLRSHVLEPPAIKELMRIKFNSDINSNSKFVIKLRRIKLMGGMQETDQLSMLAIGDGQLISWHLAVCRMCMQDLLPNKVLLVLANC